MTATVAAPVSGPGVAHLRSPEDALLRVEHLVVEFRSRAGTVQAVTDASFDVQEGETIGLAGESACGKSTTGRSVLPLPRPTSRPIPTNAPSLPTMTTSVLTTVPPPIPRISP